MLVFKGANFIEYELPSSCVLNPFQDFSSNIFELTNGVKVKFIEFLNKRNPTCEFSFEETVIKRIERDELNLQTVAGYMNKFNTYSEKELQNYVEKKMQKIKPQLQLEIEELKAEKEELEIKIKAYKEAFIIIEKLKAEFLNIENDLK